MQTYAAVISKKEKISNEVATLAQDIMSLTSFGKDKFNFSSWKSENELVHLYHWTNEPRKFLWKNGHRVVAMSGYISEQEDDFISKLLAQSNIEKQFNMVEEISGLYTLLMLDSLKMEVHYWNTITRVEQAYYAETEDHFVIGNRALIVHLLALQTLEPKYNVNRMASFLSTSYYNDDYTPYENVNILPPDSILSIKHTTLKINPRKQIEVVTENLNEQFYDDLVDAFIKSFTPLKKHDIKLNSGLTGGKDSRLIVAALKYIDANFKTHTTGFDEHPDVIIAKRIAKQLNIEHEVNRPKTDSQDATYMTQDILGRTINMLRSSDGMLSAYENVPAIANFNPNVVTLGGNGGEHLRGGFNRNVNKHNVEGYEQLLFNKLSPFKDYINPDVYKYYHEHLQYWFNQSNEHNPVDLMQKYYIFYRSGKWSSAARLGYTSSNYLYQPFFDQKLNRNILQIPAEKLLNDEIIYNILLRLNPQLVDVPFFADRWKFESKQPIDGDLKQWKRRAPLLTKQHTKSSFNWRRTTLKDMNEAMYEEIFSTRNRAVLDLIQVDNVKKLFETGQSNNREIDLFIWNLYTTAITLSNDWLSKGERSREVKIQLPPQTLVNSSKLSLSSLGWKANGKGQVFVAKKNKLVCKYTTQLNTNMYLYTFNGDFKTPPNIEQFPMSKVEDKVRLVQLSFDLSCKDNQTLSVFLMGYNDKERIFNESQKVYISNKEIKKNITLSYEIPIQVSTYKIAIKTIGNNEKGKWKIKNFKVNFYK